MKNLHSISRKNLSDKILSRIWAHTDDGKRPISQKFKINGDTIYGWSIGDGWVKCYGHSGSYERWLELDKPAPSIYEIEYETSTPN